MLMVLVLRQETDTMLKLFYAHLLAFRGYFILGKK